MGQVARRAPLASVVVPPCQHAQPFDFPMCSSVCPGQYVRAFDADGRFVLQSGCQFSSRCSHLTLGLYSLGGCLAILTLFDFLPNRELRTVPADVEPAEALLWAWASSELLRSLRFSCCSISRRFFISSVSLRRRCSRSCSFWCSASSVAKSCLNTFVFSVCSIWLALGRVLLFPLLPGFASFAAFACFAGFCCCLSDILIFGCFSRTTRSAQMGLLVDYLTKKIISFFLAFEFRCYYVPLAFCSECFRLPTSLL